MAVKAVKQFRNPKQQQQPNLKNRNKKIAMAMVHLLNENSTLPLANVIKIKVQKPFDEQINFVTLAIFHSAKTKKKHENLRQTDRWVRTKRVGEK